MHVSINVFEELSKVREQRPLVHHLTNWVTIYDCANVVRTMGALPVMAHAREEVEEMVGIASSLVLNIGTLDESMVSSMKLAADAANRKGIPIVLDVVGAGATKYRTKTCMELIENCKISVIKGNAGEIGVLAGAEAKVRGVESEGLNADKKQVVQSLATTSGSVVAMTGKEDFIGSKNKVLVVENGSEWMGKIVGTGCMAASVIGAFVAVQKDYAVASAAALSAYGIAGELAGERNPKGPGTFKESFFDELYNLDQSTLIRSKIRLA